MNNSKVFSLLAMTALGMTIASSDANAQMWGQPRTIPHFGPPPIFRRPPPVFMPIYDPYAAALNELARQRAAAELVRQQGIVCAYAPCGYGSINNDPGLVRETVRRTEEVERVYQSR